MTEIPVVRRHSRAFLQPSFVPTANNIMAVTRSQRPKSGSPTTHAPAESAPMGGRKGQKSKAKVQKTNTAASGQKAAKARKRKSPKRKGAKRVSTKSPETASREIFRSLLEASKVQSKQALKNALDSNPIFTSNSLFTAGELTPEALEELGLAYADLPGFEHNGISRELQQERSKPSPQSGTSRTLSSTTYDMFAPDPPRQTPNPPPAVPQPTPAQSSHNGNSFWRNIVNRPPISLPRAVARSPPTPRDSPQNPASDVLRLLGAIQSTPSPPLDIVKGLSDAQQQMQQAFPIDTASSFEETTSHLDDVVSDIVRQVGEQPTSSPVRIPSAGGLSGASSPEAGHANDEAQEAQRPETPVSANNAEVYKRPTVADVRRERKQMHDELEEWVRSLKFVRAELDGVVGGMEARMQVMKAVNRMQAPLRKATLRRGC